MSAKSTFFGKLAIPKEGFWAFAYGSLMWDPGFQYVESMRARIFGYHRSLCIQSIRYRGTNSNPGLVFGLDRGGSCTGVAFRVSAKDQKKVIEYLWDREMLNEIYLPKVQRVLLADTRWVKAITFVAQREHPSYVSNLTTDQTANIVAQARGLRGSNMDYVLSTLSMLESMGVRDESLRCVSRLAKLQPQSENRSV